jgi:multicomponent Na+:H+ antiporter subunit D
VIPLATAVAGLLAIGRSRLQRTIAVVGALPALGAAIALLAVTWTDGTIVLRSGGWPAPFGITLVADMFAAIMVLLAAVIGTAVVVFSIGVIDEDRERYGYYPLTHVLLMGVSGAFLTGDLFNLFVWFEVLLMASFVLMVLGGRRPQFEGGLKYVALNLISSVFFLTAVGLLYGIAGTLNMADLSVKLRAHGEDGYVTAVAMLFIAAFGIKAAMFPLFFWLPASYHVAPAPVAALFAGLLTKVGVYALIRVFTLVFTDDVSYTHTLLLWLSLITMVSGVLGTVAQQDVKRILSFHIVSQIGYMTLGLALFTPLALAGSVFYLAHIIIVKTNLFLIAGAMRRLGGTYDLRGLGGMAKAYPAIAVLFFVSAYSLGGIPPLSGFFAKFLVVRAAAEEREYIAVAAALGVGLLTLFSMTKIWTEAFMKPAPPDQHGGTANLGPTFYIPIVGLAVLSVVAGLGADPLLRAANEAAAQLMDQDAYVRAVLGDAP